MTQPEVHQEQERALRPQRLVDFTGQSSVVRNLVIAIEAAKQRNQPLDHCLLSGPPGLGKTTLAAIVALEMGAQFIETSAPALNKPGDLAGILSGMLPNTVLFIDEIHGLKSDIAEYLYSAMEDHRIAIQLDESGAAQALTLTLNPFTLIGATTRDGLLSTPFRSRFIIQERLSLYSSVELTKILERSASMLQMNAMPDALRLIGERARGTPRTANSLLRRARDWAQLDNAGILDRGTAEHSLRQLGIDAAGLTEIDRRIMTCLAQERRAVGLKTIAAKVGEEEATIEDAYEPWLIQCGMLLKTHAGRIATERGISHLHSAGIDIAADRWERAPDLFTRNRS